MAGQVLRLGIWLPDMSVTTGCEVLRLPICECGHGVHLRDPERNFPFGLLMAIVDARQHVHVHTVITCVASLVHDRDCDVHASNSDAHMPSM